MHLYTESRGNYFRSNYLPRRGEEIVIGCGIHGSEISLPLCFKTFARKHVTRVFHGPVMQDQTMRARGREEERERGSRSPDKYSCWGILSQIFSIISLS